MATPTASVTASLVSPWKVKRTVRPWMPAPLWRSDSVTVARKTSPMLTPASRANITLVWLCTVTGWVSLWKRKEPSPGKVAEKVYGPVALGAVKPTVARPVPEVAPDCSPPLKRKDTARPTMGSPVPLTVKVALAVKTSPQRTVTGWPESTLSRVSTVTVPEPQEAA